MNGLRVGAWVLGAVVFIALLALVVLWVRAAIAGSRRGSFSAWVLNPKGRQKWVRGVAIYGRSHLEWRRLWAFSIRPDLVLPRHELDVIETPTVWQGTDLLTLRLRFPTGLCSIALAPGDAAGLISWIDSSPPGE